MKKALIIIAVTISLGISLAFATEHAHGKSENKQHKSYQAELVKVENETISPPLSVTPISEHQSSRSAVKKHQEIEDEGIKEHSETASASAACDVDLKNHGAFVSCIAHQHLGGKVVSAVAKSYAKDKKEEVTSSSSFLDSNPLINFSVLRTTYKKFIKALHISFILNYPERG